MDSRNYNLSNGSPCIDSGDPSQFDLDGTRRDIGAHIIQSVATGDCNSDATLNVLDIIFIVNNCILSFDETNCDCSDINNDDVVNVLDVVSLVGLILNP